MFNNAMEKMIKEEELKVLDEPNMKDAVERL